MVDIVAMYPLVYALHKSLPFFGAYYGQLVKLFVCLFLCPSHLSKCVSSFNLFVVCVCGH